MLLISSGIWLLTEEIPDKSYEILSSKRDSNSKRRD